MTNNHTDEVVSFIEHLKKRKLADGSGFLEGELNQRLIYKEFFIINGKSYFTFEKGIFKILECFSIFVKKGNAFFYVDENFKEFKKTMGVKK